MRSVARLSALFVAFALPLASASAETYPSRPITVISPFGAGAPQDAVIRAMADAVSKDLGQPLVVDNKPGAALTLGPGVMAQTAKPDGYTISAVVSTIVLLPQMEKVGFDPARDFTYLLQVASFPLGVTVKADSPHKSWADLMAYAKANPGKVTFGSPGIGTNAHLAMELVLRNAGVEMTHVPYKGPMPILQAVLGGEVTLQVSGMEWKPNVEAGGMRLLTMLTAARHPSFPNVPAIAELGFPFDVEVPMGFVAPKDMDPAIAKRLHDAFKAASEKPDIKAIYQKYDIGYRYANGDTFKKSLEDVAARMRPVIEKLGLLVKN